MTAPAEKRSIATRYNGVLFRSKLEADWARSFDALGVQWKYEHEGRYFGNQFYLPDFWLPRSRQFVEVKGVFQPDDCKKIQSVLRAATPRAYTGEYAPDIPIVACEPNGVFRGWVRTNAPNESWWQFLTKSARVVELMACNQCRGWWFCDPSESWRCQCCGVGDGNTHVASSISSPLPLFPNVHALHFLAPN